MIDYELFMNELIESHYTKYGGRKILLSFDCGLFWEVLLVFIENKEFHQYNKKR